jgi:hypothetical protein
MTWKSGSRFSENIMVEQRDEIMFPIPSVRSMIYKAGSVQTRSEPELQTLVLARLRYATASLLLEEAQKQNAALRKGERRCLIMRSKEELQCPWQAWQRPTLPGLKP